MYTLQNLIEFLDKLCEKNIKYQLSKEYDSILIEVSVPSQKWEIEFTQDGTIRIEKFISTGEKFDDKEIDVLINEWSDDNFDPDWFDKL